MKIMDQVQELIESPLSAGELAVRYQDLCDGPQGLMERSSFAVDPSGLFK